MKLRSNPFLVVSLAFVSAATLQAATLYWDGSDTAAAVPDANGGDGDWNTSLTNWNDAATAGNAVAWPSSGTDNDAVFGGVAGTVTIAAGGVAANDLTFNTVGYLINGASLTLNGSTNILSTTTNSSTAITISAPLAGTSGFTKTGSGHLLLNGSNTGLSGIVTLPNVTGTNNAGLSLSGASSAGGITQIDINGTTGTDGQYLSLANVTLASTVTLNLSGQGGNSAPIGTLRASSAPAVVEGPVNLLTPNVRISSSGSGSELRINGKIDDGVNSYGVSFRFGDGNGVYLTNTTNDWGGDTTSTGILRAVPGAIPATSRIIVGASGNGWFQTYGTLTRSLGTTSGSGALDLSNSTANRIVGLAARGGTLAVNLGGSAADMIWGTTVGFNPSIFGLNNSTADSAISLANPLDLNGANRLVHVDANTATLTGGIKNSSATAAGVRKLGAGTLAHDPGAEHTVSLQSVQTGAGTLDVKSGTLTLSSGASTTYSVGMNGFTVVGGSTFRLSGGTVNAQVAVGSVFTAGHTTGGSGNFILNGGTFDAGGREILNAYGAPGTTTINDGTFICGAFRVAQSTGTLNLNGGTLRANNLSHGGGNSTVSFNGGTLQAKTNAGSFVPTTLTNTIVRAGGAVIDSNGFNVTIAQALTEDSGFPGGGLTKNGAGILSLTGDNTYTGVTTINAGTVSIASLEDGGVAGNLGAATSDAANIVFGGGALQFSAATAASSNRGFTINAASSATFNVSNASGALTMTATVPTTTGILYKTGAGEMTLDPGVSASISLGALSGNGGNLILKSGTISTTSLDSAVNAYSVGAGARGGTLTIDGATLNVGGGRLLKPGANGNGNLNILSGEVNAPSIVIGHNGTVAATQSGGNVTTTNLYHQDAGVGSSYTLTDGTLTARRIYNNTAGAHDFTLNLNGGTLKSAIGTTNLIDNQNAGTQIAVLLGDGNTIIDTTDSDATIVRPMGDMPSVAGTFTKGGNNTLTLTGTNTYTGATSVTAGTLALVGGSQTSPITVESGAALGLTLGLPTTSTSTVTFSGLTAKVTVTGTPVAATLMTASSITGTPVLDPAIPGFELAIEGGGTLLNLIATSGTPFETWATTNGLAGADALPGADPDNDGLDNLIEFVIGGQPNPANPNADSSALAPTVSTDASSLIFTFRRTELALGQPGIVIAPEYGSNLADWSTATHGVGGVTVVPTDDHFGPGIDRIVVTIPKALVPGTKMFARLNVEIP